MSYLPKILQFDVANIYNITIANYYYTKQKDNFRHNMLSILLYIKLTFTTYYQEVKRLFNNYILNI